MVVVLLELEWLLLLYGWLSDGQAVGLPTIGVMNVLFVGLRLDAVQGRRMKPQLEGVRVYDFAVAVGIYSPAPLLCELVEPILLNRLGVPCTSSPSC